MMNRRFLTGSMTSSLVTGAIGLGAVFWMDRRIQRRLDQERQLDQERRQYLDRIIQRRLDKERHHALETDSEPGTTP